MLPEGPGIAASYPNDVGLGEDPRVLLFEDFRVPDVSTLQERWENVSNPAGMRLVNDTPTDLPEDRALEVTATLGKDTGGHLYSRLPRGVDLAFARFYVKFPEDADYVHHFVTLGGYHPSTPWPQGGAGERPVGNDRVTVGIEPFGYGGRFPPPGAWNFYVYWHEMKMSADGRYWGNGLQPVEPQPVPRGRWQCVEVMLKMNSSPEVPDGELALWLDGQLVAHFKKGVPRGRWTGMGFRLLREGGEPFEGFRWRTSEDLKINFFWLMHYVTEQAVRRSNPNPRPRNRVLFDQVVVATEYVGPIRSR